MNEQLNRIPSGFITLTKDGIILSINRTLLEWLGYNIDQVVGQPFNLILSKSARAFIQLYFFRVIITGKQVKEMYLTLMHRNGKEIPILMNASFGQHLGCQVITCIMISIKNRNEYVNQLMIAKKVSENAYYKISQANAELEQALRNLELKEQRLKEVNRQNEKFRENIQKELKLAENIQSRSLPFDISTNKIETVSYYLASGELSGDIYGFQQINEHRYGIIILDVMGKGISAALITMSLQSLFQMLITRGTAPDIIMRKLDDHLHGLFKNKQDLWHYSTGICLIIDTKEQTISCTNAGHPPAIFQTSTGEQTELGATSPPLGTFKGIKFKVETLTYDKGSKILLYTDGISEMLIPHQLGLLCKEHFSGSLQSCKDKILQVIHSQGDLLVKDDQCFILIGLT